MATLTGTRAEPGADSVSVSGMPAGLDVYCGYVTGTYNNYLEVQKQFPGKLYVGISTSVAPTDCYDVESGGGIAPDCPAFQRQSTHPNLNKPMYYASLDIMGTVINALGGAGYQRDTYYLFLADWDGKAPVPSGYDAIQYQNHPGYDSDTFNSYIFRTVTPPPPPPPPPPVVKGTQSAWNWCHKCQGLYYGPHASSSVCPAGGNHAPGNSYDYSLEYES